MTDKNDLGVSIGSDHPEGEEGSDQVEQILDQLEVSDLSKLSAAQVRELTDELERQAGLEGVDIGRIEREGGRQGIADRARSRTRQQEEMLEEQLLQDVQDVATDEPILRELARQQKATNQVLSVTNELMTDLVEATVRGKKLLVKDTNAISFDRANNARDVVEDDNVSTSEVIVKADPRNPSGLFVGTGSLSVGDGFRLEAGESQRFPVDAVSREFKIISPNTNSEYSYIALGN